jgi:predicted ATPase/DNA-binding XRE family transcriptional regulator
MLDLTQKELARQAGCSVVALQKIERDERRPSRQLADRLMEFLDVPPDQRTLLLKVARRERGADSLPSVPRLAALPMKESKPTHSPSRLPISPTPLVGRKSELSEIVQLLHNPHCRLLTLVGSGGTGKTRLALEAARQIQGGTTHGAHFVSLAGVSAPEFIIPTIAEALGFMLAGQADSKTQLLNYLREKQMLLVLDNFEHLLDGAELLNEILQHAPDTKLLVTSRELLHLQAEWAFEVLGLSVSHNAQSDELESSSAATLFLQRARQVRTHFILTEPERLALLRICQLVQGLPLAIELAAAWVRTLSCQEIAREIEQGLSFLETTTRDIPERHRSITAVFDQSWKSLSSEEQRVLRQLSVFRGGFTRKAAEQVAGANLSLLSVLVDKSLLHHNDAHGGCFELHELIRQYAIAHLEEHAMEERAVRERHSHYYLSLLESYEPALRSRSQKETLARLNADIDNLRTAWDVAVSAEEIERLRHAGAAFFYFFELHQYFHEAEAAYKRGAEMIRTRLANYDVQKDAGLEGALADMLNYQAFFNMRAGNNAEALSLFQTSLELLRSIQETYSLAFALVHYGVIHWAVGNFDEAARALGEGLSTSRKLALPWLQALAEGFLGGVTHDKGEYVEGYRFLNNAMELCRTMDDPYFLLLIGAYFSRSAQALGRLHEAQTVLHEGLHIARESGNRWSISLGLERLGVIAQALGDNAEAQRLLAESISLQREIGDQWSLAWVLHDIGRLALSRADSAEAERYVLEAIKVAAEAGYYPNALDALATLSTIRAQQNLSASALEMVLYILQHPSSTQDAKDRAARLRFELESKLASHEIETLRMRIQTNGLEAFGV